MLKNKKGITLVALVVTIIILLILAGITLNTLGNENGILNKVNLSANKYKKAELEERIHTLYAEAKAESIGNKTKLTAEKFAKILEKQGIAVILDDADSTNIILKSKEGYNILISEESSGEIEIVVSNNKINSMTPILITAEAEKTTSSTITVQVNGKNNEDARYTYSILLDGQLIKKETTTETSYTFKGLTHKTTYNINVKAVSVSNGIATSKIEGKTKLVQGIEIGGVNWSLGGGNGEGTVTITNITEIAGSTIEYKVITTEGKTDVTTDNIGYTQTEGVLDENGHPKVDVLVKNGQTIRARIYDGRENRTENVDRDILEGAAPTVNVVLDKERALLKERITAQVEQSDEQSGLDISNCKWIFNKTGEAIGAETSAYESETYPYGTFTSEAETIEFKGITEGTHYLHILSVDKAENKIEIIKQVEVKDNNSIIGQISKIEESGYSDITITGKLSNGTSKTETYRVHTIVHNGDLELNGTSQVNGATLKNNVYEFGDATRDVATASANASSTVVLKVNGNLKINSGVTLTACRSAQNYGGPKGMLIFCSGTITNNGTINMTARGAKANGQDVFLWQNANGTYEYVPAVGAIGGDQLYTSKHATVLNGNAGRNGAGRQTGGGGTGAGRNWDYSITIGKGGNGTSYSGGSGSGAANSDGTASGSGGATSAAAPNNGGAGGNGAVKAANQSGYGQISIGGTGNPSGGYANYRVNPTNYVARHGTGGLLVMYCNEMINNNFIIARGVESSSAGSSNSYSRVDAGGASGGGSINIFYNTQYTNNKTIDSNGGNQTALYGGATGGRGGNGTVSVTEMSL